MSNSDIHMGKQSEQVPELTGDMHTATILFQKELENLLALLVKENSLDVLSDELLMRCVNITHSSFGIVLFTDESIGQQADNKAYLEDDQRDKDNIVSIIKGNLNYITKWLKLNKRSLQVKNTDTANIGYNLITELQKENLSITPCFMGEELLAVIIAGRAGGAYSFQDINNLEQFSSLLAFAVNNLLTRSLNTALENKLLQSQKLETIGKLASGMAHDFNNLLSSIFGSLNLLKRRLSDRPDISYLLDNIENCSVRAADLTKGLLSYGKPTSKRKTLIKPAGLLKELIGVVEQTFPGNIEIVKEFDSALPDIMGNATEIYQVLLNLCINAKEAIHGAGRITISAQNFRLDDKNVFDFPLLRQGEYIRFSVTDTGEGISPENMSKIFDPYFSTKQKETGSGLGLYVTYGIVKAHNGVIDLSSRPGKGTRFDVYIPAFIKDSSSSAAKTEKIILLADDEIMLRDLLAELLESYNFDVICVQNGREVLTVLTEEIKVDLLVIDYKMPEMDGMACIKKIRELELDVPIILSTGSASVKAEEEFKKLRIESILTKPYEFEQMLAEIQKFI